jgi:2',3'-cyclic-nucleotide 2'-phosphodiesterase (5'-nucleotidase family)
MSQVNVGKLEEVGRVIERFAGRLAAVVVHINDTYVVEERPADAFPGFPRLIGTVDKLRGWTRRHCGEDRVLVVHSGDFLAPSLLARKDKGETMVQFTTVRLNEPRRA